MAELIFLSVSVVLVIICGLFVAAEFALIAVNRSSVERLADKGDKSAIGVRRAIGSLSTQLSGAQVGITITNLAIGFLAEPAISKLLEAPLVSIGFSDKLVTVISLIIGISIATAITMIFGELVPKNLAISRPMVTAKFIQRPIQIFSHLMKYPIKILNGSANFLLKQLNVEPQEELASARSADELLSLVRRSAEKGTLPKETAQMLERTLNFGDLTALDVMTPRVQVDAITRDSTVSEVLKTAKSTGHSRFPVYNNNLDEIVGVVHIKHAVGVPISRRNNVLVSQIMRPPVLVPSNIQLEPLLDALRKGGLQMAIVIDEFGGTDGIVTIEDLLEELVGEVQDEHDRLKVEIHKQANGSWLLSGLLRPDEVGEEIGIFLPEEDDSETIAGSIAHHLEKLPEVNDTVQLKAVDRDGNSLVVELIVDRMDAHRVDKVRMMIVDQSKASEMETES